MEKFSTFPSGKDKAAQIFGAIAVRQRLDSVDKEKIGAPKKKTLTYINNYRPQATAVAPQTGVIRTTEKSPMTRMAGNT